MSVDRFRALLFGSLGSPLPEGGTRLIGADGGDSPAPADASPSTTSLLVTPPGSEVAPSVLLHASGTKGANQSPDKGNRPPQVSQPSGHQSLKSLGFKEEDYQ